MAQPAPGLTSVRIVNLLQHDGIILTATANVPQVVPLKCADMDPKERVDLWLFTLRSNRHT